LTPQKRATTLLKQNTNEPEIQQFPEESNYNDESGNWDYGPLGCDTMA
jgi:hypothetical protein